MKWVIAGFVVAIDRDTLETVDGPPSLGEDEDGEQEANDPRVLYVHVSATRRWFPTESHFRRRQLLHPGL